MVISFLYALVLFITDIKLFHFQRCMFDELAGIFLGERVVCLC
jgi:hypothetical protein